MNTWKVGTLVSIIIVLSGCAVIRHETRLVTGQWPEGDVSNELAINSNVNLSSSCVGNSPFLFGPWLLLPLPLFPDPYGPIYYYNHKNTRGIFKISVEASATAPSDYRFEITIVGALLKLTDTRLADPKFAASKTRRIEYTFISDRECGDLEDQRIYIMDKSQPPSFTAIPVYLRHRWKLYLDPI